VGLLLTGDDGRFAASEPPLALHAAGGDLAVSGRARFALEAEGADLLFATARGTRGETLSLLLPARDPGGALRPVALVDATRRFAEAHLDAVPVGDGALLGGSDGDVGDGRGAAALGEILDAARAALAAELCGAARQALELSLRHARAREQFGRPIGSFQAIQHRCADMLVRVEGACSAAWYAAWAVETRAPDAHRAACLAKAVASDACRRVTGDAIQVHGGLGFTWEQDPQLYYKRARSSEMLLGDASFHYELAARELLDGETGSGMKAT
jgi:alkylation response protein AidB-like acyl-CoA dehydrogenase